MSLALRRLRVSPVLNYAWLDAVPVGMRDEEGALGSPNTFTKAYIMTTYPIQVWIRYAI